jgi:hypothetical protein
VSAGDGRRGAAPQPKKIDDTHVCRSCTLRLEKVVILSDSVTRMGSSNNLTVIDKDSRGRYWVADYRSRSNVLVFAPDGRLVKRIGREGSGPGKGDDEVARDLSRDLRAPLAPATLDDAERVTDGALADGVGGLVGDAKRPGVRVPIDER